MAKRGRVKDVAKLNDSHDLQLFRQLLLSKYGTFVRAWRYVLDSDGSGRVTVAEFVAGCKKLNFPGDAVHLFHELSGEDNLLELDELDPESAQALTAFANFIRSEFGTVIRAFAYGLDLDKSRGITEEEFVHASMQMGFQCASYKRLYECLDFDQNGQITLDELLFLEHWKNDIFRPRTATEQLRQCLRSNQGSVHGLVHLVARGATPDARPGDPGECTKSGRPMKPPALPQQESALMKAAERGDDEAVERLLRWGADPNLRNGFGQSALHRLAMRSRHTAREAADVERILKLLVAFRADPNAQTPAGSTPLHLAVNIGNASTALALLQCRADPILRDKQNRSPLFFGVYKANTACVKVLLAFLADPCRNDRNDITPLDYAKRYQRHDIMLLLQEHTKRHYPRLLCEGLDELCREEDYGRMRVKELRALCRERALDHTGQIKDLVQQLRFRAFQKAPKEAEELLTAYLELGGVEREKLREITDAWWERGGPSPLVGIVARTCLDVLGT